MELYILDQSYNSLAIVDVFESAIWTDRYLGYGDFELYLPMSIEALDIFQIGRYLWTKKSDRLMIIEDIEIETTAEDGNKLIVTGRSLESILDRRIIWRTTTIQGSLQDGIVKLLNENVISPSDTRRTIPGFAVRMSSDPEITNLTIDMQFFGENLYEAIYALCESEDIGFRILPNGSGGFLFELYTGKNRSYDQETNPWVVFSPHFENILSSNYLLSDKTLKTAALVVGEGEGSAQKTAEAITVNASGLDRKEIFAEAYGVSSSIYDDEGNETVLPDSQYLEILKEKGREALMEQTVTESFEGEIDSTQQFVYGKDFQIGDIVQVVNEYGMESKCRVSEIIQSSDVENGEVTTPTFVTVI